MPCVARGPAPTAVRLRGATAGATTDGARRGRFCAAGRATAAGALAVLSSCRHTGCTLLHTLQAHNMHTHTHTSPWERAVDKGSWCRKSHKPSEAIQTAWATSAGQWRILWTLGSGTVTLWTLARLVVAAISHMQGALALGDAASRMRSSGRRSRSRGAAKQRSHPRSQRHAVILAAVRARHLLVG